MSARWRNLWLLAIAELLAMTLWFSATAVVPQLTVALALSEGQQSWLTMSVQIGFVVGALLYTGSEQCSSRRGSMPVSGTAPSI